MKDFSSLVLDFTSEYESPSSFWKWSSYATIAATLRDRVYLKHRIGDVYPNVYVLLIADAGLRKGPPVSLANEFLTRVKTTKVIKGRNSIQYVQERLAMDGMERGSNGLAIKGGSGILLAPELGAFFVNDPSLSEIMSGMYDFEKEYPIGLKSNNGSQSIKNLCLSMLGASNETFLREVYTMKAVYGGLLRRTFMVESDEDRPGKSLFQLSKLPEKDFTELTDSLKEIQKLSGPIQQTDEAECFYDKWYQALYETFKRKKDRTGFMQSSGTLVLKLAIIIAAGQYTIEITKDHIEQAIEEIIKLKPVYEKYAMSSGKANYAQIGGVILDDFWNAPGHRLTKKSILFNHWSDIKEEDLDALTGTLENAGMLKTVWENNQAGWEMTKVCIGIYETKTKEAQDKSKG